MILKTKVSFNHKGKAIRSQHNSALMEKASLKQITECRNAEIQNGCKWNRGGHKTTKTVTKTFRNL